MTSNKSSNGSDDDVDMVEMSERARRYLIECYFTLQRRQDALQFSKETSSIKPHRRLIIEWLVRFYTDDVIGSFQLAKELSSPGSIDDTNGGGSCSGDNDEDDNYDVNLFMTKSAYQLLASHAKLIGDELVSDDADEIRHLCFQANIKAIKLCPYKWETIFYLGKYYKYLLGDYKKALKCFQKAYELCHTLSLCGLELVDCLLHEKEEDIAFSVLKRAIDEIENCKWASLRLGIIYLKRGEPNEAIRLFYNVIRNDPNDFNMWECLADAYLSRASLTASLKSFSKALELNPESTYALYQFVVVVISCFFIN